MTRPAETADLRAITPDSPEWPTQLDDLPDRPERLWLRGPGDLADLTARAVAMVGSRAATSYGTHIAAELAYDLARHGVTIISGGAFGIDAAAHRAALSADTATVLVAAHGLDRTYPAGHAALFEQIARTGLIVSEHPPGTAPTRSRLVHRNRIIAALAQATVVVEAAARSGALSTAAQACALHHPVRAVPGPITSATSVGCHTLLRDRHAALATSAADILTHLTDVSRLTRPGGPAQTDRQPVSTPHPNAELTPPTAARPPHIGGARAGSPTTY
jgi:DNA processing protein